MSTLLLTVALLGVNGVTSVEIPVENSPIEESGQPSISLSGYPAYANYWYFTGTVTDPDDYPAGWTVTYWGAISGQATVLTDQTFSFVGEIFGYGTVYVQVHDPQGNGSNIAWTVVW